MNLIGPNAVPAPHPIRRSLHLLLLLHLILAARAGVVETLDGRILRGGLEFKAGNALIVTSSNEPSTLVALTNLLRADFNSATNDTLPGAAVRLDAPVLDEDRGALPVPWRHRDIGQVEKGGNAAHFHGTFTLAGGHREQRKAGDGFHFVYQSFRGNGEIVARVASVEPRDQKDRQARAGVLMRASLEPESLSVLMAVSGGLGTYFRKWGKATEFPAQDRREAFNPPYWVKLVRDGNRFAGYQSSDGQAWRLLAETTAPMPDRLFVGLAMINTRKGEVARSTFDHVTVGATTLAGRFVTKVVLRDGTVIADPFTAVDDSAIAFSTDKKGLTVRTADVARLLFQQIEEAQFPQSGRAGLLLRNGDFVDGDFRGLADGRVKISSVLFGLRSYELKNRVAAVLLGAVAPPPVAFELKTLDGSTWRARGLAVESGSLRLLTPLTGSWRIPLEELVEIRRGGATMAAATVKLATP